MRKYHRFIPSTLKDVDRQLLLNRPVLWATRFHYVAFFCVVLWALVSFKLGTFTPDLTDVPNPSLHGMLLFIPALLAIGFWAFHAHLFNSKRLFGEMTSFNELRNQAIYLGGVLLIASAPIVYGVVVSQKLADAATAEELTQDINTLNIGDQFFKIMPHALKGYPFQGDYNCFQAGGGFYGHLNKTDAQSYIYGFDQVERMRNSASRCSQKRYIQAYKDVLHKYSGHEIAQSNNKVLHAFNHDEYIFGEKLAMARKATYSNLMRLTEAKAKGGIFQATPSLQLLFFMILILSIGFWVFVKASWKFFLSALALTGGLLLLVLVGGALLSHGLRTYVNVHINEEDMFLMMLIGACGVLLFQGLGRKNIFSFTNWPAVATTSSFMLLPAIGLGLLDFGRETLHYGRLWGETEGSIGLLGIFICCSLLWNIFYSPQLDSLNMKPKTR